MAYGSKEGQHDCENGDDPKVGPRTRMNLPRRAGPINANQLIIPRSWTIGFTVGDSYDAGSLRFEVPDGVTTMLLCGARKPLWAPSDALFV